MAMNARRAAALLLALLSPLPGCTQAEQAIWLEHSIEPVQPYVGQQVRYTLRLYQGISLDTLRFVPPASPLAEVRPHGEANIQEHDRDGRRYRVTEQHYALFPFASGKTELRGGQALATRAGMPASASLALEAPSITLDVRPATSGGTSWLPAAALNLSETWSQSSSSPRVGEALQRTVRVEAQGLQAAQIPPLEIAGPGFAAHRLPPTLLDRSSPEGITGIREETWLIVPAAPGPLQVPPLTVDWFDTSRHAPARSQLPPFSLDIAPAPHQPALGTTPPAEPTPSAGTAESLPPPPPADHAPATEQPFFMVIAAVFGVLLVAGLAALALRHRRTGASPRTLRTACRHNDLHAAHAAALAWCRHLAPQSPASLPALGRHLGDAALAQELVRLDAARFGPTNSWQGQSLLAALRRHRHAKRKIRVPGEL